MHLSPNLKVLPAQLPGDERNQAQAWVTTIVEAFERKDQEFPTKFYENSEAAFLETENLDSKNLVWKGTAALQEGYKWWFSGFDKVEYVLTSVVLIPEQNQVLFTLDAKWWPLPHAAEGLKASLPLEEEGYLKLPMTLLLTRSGKGSEKFRSMQLYGEIWKLAALCKAGAGK